LSDRDRLPAVPYNKHSRSSDCIFFSQYFRIRTFTSSQRLRFNNKHTFRLSHSLHLRICLTVAVVTAAPAEEAVVVVTVVAMGTITFQAAITIPVAIPMGMTTYGLIVAKFNGFSHFPLSLSATDDKVCSVHDEFTLKS
jgi:hypothetical protein